MAERAPKEKSLSKLSLLHSTEFSRKNVSVKGRITAVEYRRPTPGKKTRFRESGGSGGQASKTR